MCGGPDGKWQGVAKSIIIIEARNHQLLKSWFQPSWFLDSRFGCECMAITFMPRQYDWKDTFLWLKEGNRGLSNLSPVFKRTLNHSSQYTIVQNRAEQCKLNLKSRSQQSVKRTSFVQLLVVSPDKIRNTWKQSVSVLLMGCHTGSFSVCWTSMLYFVAFLFVAFTFYCCSRPKAPINGIYNQEGPFYILKYLAFKLLLTLRKVWWKTYCQSFILQLRYPDTLTTL